MAVSQRNDYRLVPVARLGKPFGGLGPVAGQPGRNTVKLTLNTRDLTINFAENFGFPA
jgi:hypothetical protein